MFKRDEYLKALADLTPVERGDVWCLLAYLMLIGPQSRPTLRKAFHFMQGSFDFYVHFLVKHYAIKLTPDQWDGEPMIAISQRVLEVATSINTPLKQESNGAAKSA